MFLFFFFSFNRAESPPTLFFLFKIFLVLFNPFHFHTHFRIRLWVFTDTWRNYLDFDWDCIVSVNRFEESLYNTHRLSILQHAYPFMYLNLLIFLNSILLFCTSFINLFPRSLLFCWCYCEWCHCQIVYC